MSQPGLAASDPASITRLLHLFPTGTRTADHLILGGVPYGSHRGINTALSAAVQRYKSTLTRLLAIPAIPTQLRLLILLLSARPSSLFAHHLRALSPFYTTAASASHQSYARTLRSLLHTATAGILRIPHSLITSPDAAAATHLQILLPSALGGINLPDAVLLAHPASLASFADSLPLLLDDRILAPSLIDTASWAASASPTLSAVSSSFHEIAPLLVSRIDTNPLHPSVRARLTARDGSLALSLLHAVGGRHSQSVFSHAVFAHLRDTLIAPTTALSDLSRARFRAAAAPLTHSLFTLYYIPAASSLDHEHIQFLVCHRLGIPLPFIRQTPPPSHCAPACHLFPPDRPIPLGHDLYATLGHLLHHLACGAGGFRTARHESLIHIIAEAARVLVQASVDTQKRLCSSAYRGTKVDIVISTFHLAPFIVAIDGTVSCPLSPAYMRAASHDADAIFVSRAKSKNHKHKTGCEDIGRAFLPIVFTTFGGIGPPEARAWLDSLFSTLYANERAAGGTGHETTHRRLLFFQSLQAVLVRSTTTMAIRLSAPMPTGSTGPDVPSTSAPLPPSRSRSAP